MRVAIVGCRDFVNEAVIFPLITQFLKEHCVGTPTIVSGGAKGIDTIAKKYAHNFGFDFFEYLPYHLLDDKIEFSSKYYFIRNKQIVQNADIVLAIWDGVSKGTEHAIKYSQKIGVPVMIVRCE